MDHFTRLDLREPKGWVVIPTYDIKRLKDKESTNDVEKILESPLSAFCFEIKVLANHHHGKDVRVRQLKVFGKNDDNKNRLDVKTGNFLKIKLYK